MEQSLTEVFERRGWHVHEWRHGEQDVTVLHQEPFRLRWIATKLVTFVFLIPRTPPDYGSVLADYAALRRFAGRNKQTILPFGFQCGYALLPVYVGTGFDESLRATVRETFAKRWCVFHVPSLFDTGTGEFVTVEAKTFWGSVYRGFIHDVLTDIANVLREQGTPLDGTAGEAPAR
jgi:hypothetical protein